MRCSGRRADQVRAPTLHPVTLPCTEKVCSSAAIVTDGCRRRTISTLRSRSSTLGSAEGRGQADRPQRGLTSSGRCWLPSRGSRARCGGHQAIRTAVSSVFCGAGPPPSPAAALGLQTPPQRGRAHSPSAGARLGRHHSPVSRQAPQPSRSAFICRPPAAPRSEANSKRKKHFRGTVCHCQARHLRLNNAFRSTTSQQPRRKRWQPETLVLHDMRACTGPLAARWATAYADADDQGLGRSWSRRAPGRAAGPEAQRPRFPRIHPRECNAMQRLVLHLRQANHFCAILRHTGAPRSTHGLPPRTPSKSRMIRAAPRGVG